MRIAGMLRVKNEVRWIEKVLASLLPVCDTVTVLDDHSDDDTLLICQSMPKVNAFESPFSGLDESRDKNHLLEIVEQQKPDWIIAIDGDEMLSPRAQSGFPVALQSQSGCLSLRIWYLWDREDQVRTDGVYGDFHRASIFRPTGARFPSNGGANFHCGNVPIALRQKRQVLELDILHFGYMHREDRIRKYQWYNAQDPNNAAEDAYRHMVIGDVFPADSKFAFGGPLKLEAIRAS